MRFTGNKQLMRKLAMFVLVFFSISMFTNVGLPMKVMAIDPTLPTIEKIDTVIGGSGIIHAVGQNFNSFEGSTVTAAVYDMEDNSIVQTDDIHFILDTVNAMDIIIPQDTALNPGQYNLKVWQDAQLVSMPNGGTFNVVPYINTVATVNDVLGSTIRDANITVTEDVYNQWSTGEQIELILLDESRNMVWTSTDPNSEMMVNEDSISVMLHQASLPIKAYTFEAYRVADNQEICVGDVEFTTFTVNNSDNNSYVGLEAIADIGLLNAGVENNILFVSGRSTPPSGESMNFDVAFNQVYEDDYNLNIQFADALNYWDLDPLVREATVPVDPNAPTNIELEYRDMSNNLLARVNFMWSPVNNEEPQPTDIWSDVLFGYGWQCYGISADPVIELDIMNFIGANENLSVKLDYYNPTSGEVINQAVLGKAELIGEESGRKTFRFTCDVDDYNNLINVPNDTQLLMTAIYNDEITGQFSQKPMGEIRLDKKGPSPWAQYYGQIQDPESLYNGYHKVVVDLGDAIDVDSIVVNKDEHFKLVKKDGTSIFAAYAEAYVMPTDPPEAPVRAIMLYFEALESGNRVEVKGISDFVGNTMPEPVLCDVNTSTHVTGYMYDRYGSPMYKAEAHLVNMDELLSGNIDYVPIYTIVSDDFGYFDTWLNAGNYKLCDMQQVYEDGYIGNYESLDEDIVIPTMTNGESFSFNIQPMTPNVTGIVTKAPDQYEEDKLVFMDTKYLTEEPWISFPDTKMIEKVFTRRVTAYAQSDFSLYLRPGTYKLLGKQVGYSIVPPLNEVIFTVPETGDYRIENTIEFPTMNITGTIVDQNGNPVTYSNLVIFDVNNPGTPCAMAFTDESGKFSAVLADGSYKIDGLCMEGSYRKTGGLYSLNVTFDVVGGLAQNVAGPNQEGNTLDGIKLPAPNLSVRITENGASLPIDDSYASIEFIGNGQSMWVGTGTGEFNFYLLPGTYYINSIWARCINIQDLNKEIVITGEEVGMIQEEIDIAGQSNTIVRVVDESGNKIANVGIPVNGISNYINDWRKTNENGEAYYNLEPGVYKINGYDQDCKWNEVNIEFTVTESNTPENPCIVTIMVKAPNIVGIALDNEGKAITDGWVSLRKLPADANSFEQYLGFKTDKEGRFGTNLEAGTYIVDGVGNQITWYEMNFKFLVVDVNGTLQVQLPDGTPVEGDLIIQRQPDNLKGHVYKGYDDQNNPITYKGRSLDPNFDPTWSIDVWLVLKEAGIAEDKYNEMPWIYEKWIEVKADGSFSVTVDSSKKYSVKAIVDAGRYIEINSTEVVSLPQTDWIIVPPTPNLSGYIKDYDGNPIAKGWLNISTADNTEWLGTDVDDSGWFGKNLEVGKTYIIREMGRSYEVKSEDPSIPSTWMWESFPFNKEITITEDMQPIELRLNVKGVVSIGEIDIPQDPNMQVYAGIIIRPEILESDPRYKDFSENPWKYERWVQMTIGEGGIATFYTSLDEGNYKIVGISHTNGWIEVNKTFSINKQTSGIVTYEADKDRYAINLNYQPNVTGAVLETDGTPVAEAWVNIEKIIEREPGDYTWIPGLYFGANTNADGQFKLKLEDGDYKISGYSTRGFWQDGNWQCGKWVQIDYKFKVVDGQLTDNNGNALDSINIRPNVTGVVQKWSPETNQFVSVKDAWLSIKPTGAAEDDYQSRIWVGTGSAEKFSLMLAPGNYTVVDAGAMDFWTRVDYNFTIDAEGNIVDDGVNVIDGTLYVRPQQPNFVGTAYSDQAKTQPLNWGGLVIKPMNASEYDWDKAIWIGTNEKGYFEFKVAEGQWKVVSISDAYTWKKVCIPFTVDAEGVVTSSVAGFVAQDGKITVAPQKANFSGIIKDKDGNQINKQAWISIKKDGEAEYEWQNYFGMEYKQTASGYMFEDNLEPGSYTITNVGGMDFWFEVNIKFSIGQDGTLTQITPNTVVDGKMIIKPALPNVSGHAYGTVNGEEIQLTNGWIGFARFDEDGNQLTIEGQAIADDMYNYKDQFTGIYWNHTRWCQIDDKGDFGMMLPEGNYKVINVGAQNIWYQPYSSFEVTADQNTVLEVREPAPNVTIIVKNTGSNSEQAWIDVQFKKDDMTYYVPFKLDHKNGDEFIFKATLNKGDYQVTSFGTWDMWSSLDYQFTVGDGNTIVTVDVNNDTKKKVSGTILNSGSPISERAWIAILPVVDGQVDLTAEKKWVQTDEFGNFMFKLAEGKTFAIVELSTSQGYYTLSNPQNYAYTVTSDAVQQGWQVDLNTIE